ncbi:MAG: hypothetical protein ACHQ1D_03650 [Nitrososphaerales archaeon]|jgi:hypothetical protein
MKQFDPNKQYEISGFDIMSIFGSCKVMKMIMKMRGDAIAPFIKEIEDVLQKIIDKEVETK